MPPPEASEAEVLAYLREQHGALYERDAWTRRGVLAAEPDFSELVQQAVGQRLLFS